MKILLVYKFFIPHWGGIETLMYTIAKGLSQYCEKVAVLTTANYKLDDLLVKEIGRVKVIQVSAYYMSKKIDLSFSISKIISTIKSYDLIYVFGCLPSSIFIYALLLGKLFNRLVVWHPAYFPGTTKTSRSKTSKILRFIHDKILLNLYSKFSSAILASTDDEVRIFSRVSNTKIYLVGECVDDPLPIKESEIDEVLNRYKLLRNKYVLSVGRIAYYKGQDLLINAWKEIEKEFPEFKLVIVGEDWGLKQSLISMIEKYNLKNVMFTGSIDIRELNALYEGAFVVAAPSKFEAFHRIALEAWSHKKPIIALDLGGATRHITPENGILIREHIRDLEEALRKVILQPSIAEILGKNGYMKFRENYTKDVYAQKLLRIFKLLINSRIKQISSKERKDRQISLKST